MKLSKILILSLGMALCAAGGVGTALAAVSKTKAESTSTASYDKAIYLYWDHESETSSHLGDLESVTEEPQYKYLEVSPKSSKSVAGTITLGFTLAEESDGLPAGKNPTTKGITVKVYELDDEATYENFQTYVSTGTLKCTLTGPSTLTGAATFSVTASSGVHETVKKYAIEVTWAPAGVLANEQVSATLSISQSFALAA